MEELIDLDVAALERQLAKIGWTLSKLEASIGKEIKSKISIADKRLIWNIIKYPDIRNHLLVFRTCFSGATITDVRHIS